MASRNNSDKTDRFNINIFQVSKIPKDNQSDVEENTDNAAFIFLIVLSIIITMLSVFRSELLSLFL